MMKMRATWVTFLYLIFSAIAFGQPGKVAADVLARLQNGHVDVIVQFASTPSQENHDRVGRRGGELRGELPSIRAAIYSIPPQAVAALADDDDVVYISPDRPVEAMLDYTNPTVGAPYALASGWDGTGIGIAVIDSGVADTRDLLAAGSSASNTTRVVYSQSFVKNNSSTLDQYGHGTHVA